MGKKATGKHYISKGERPNVSKKHKARGDERSVLDVHIDKLNAWFKAPGDKKREPKLTIENPNPNATRERYIRVPISQVYTWIDPRNPRGRPIQPSDTVAAEVPDTGA